MSRQELVSAFMEGRISRRTLVRRLVAGGVSAGAAVSYAQMLNPERADAASGLVIPGDHYPMVDLSITSTSLATVKSEKKLQINVIGSRGARQRQDPDLRPQHDGRRAGRQKHFPNFPSEGEQPKRQKISINDAQFATQTPVRFYAQLWAGQRALLQRRERRGDPQLERPLKPAPG